MLVAASVMRAIGRGEQQLLDTHRGQHGHRLGEDRHRDHAGVVQVRDARQPKGADLRQHHDEQDDRDSPASQPPCQSSDPRGRHRHRLLPITAVTAVR